jgi:hypothetical protein
MAHFLISAGGRRSLLHSLLLDKRQQNLFGVIDKRVEFESLGTRDRYEAERFGVRLKNGKQVVRER